MISLNILFANDDVLTQWVMTEVLTGAGFTVASACRGSQVVELLEDASDFDMLLIDLALPDMAATSEIVEFWRGARPGRPILYTGARQDALREPLRRNEGFVRTPFSAGVLLRTIDLLLEEAFYQPALPAVIRSSNHVH